MLGRRFSLDEDIRQPVLSFICSLSSHSSHLSLTVLLSSLVLSKSFVIVYDLFILFPILSYLTSITVIRINKSGRTVR